jgi:ribose/xylose/arabinose/galactoside ABC-type transport system permease subunit
MNFEGNPSQINIAATATICAWPMSYLHKQTHNMKVYILSALLACQTIAAIAQDRDGKTPYMTKSLASDAISSVVVNTSAGGIEVSGRAGRHQGSKCTSGAITAAICQKKRSKNAWTKITI